MKPSFEQLSIFDIVMEHDNPPTIEPQQNPQKDTERVTTNKNRCPYKIPTVDEIFKRIDRASYKVSKNKLISDVIECGALAISNQIDLTKYDEREERYKLIMNSYKPKERELLAEIFGMIFALLSSVVYDDGVFNDYLGELFMKCNLGNKKMGQCFTPYHICKFMANVAIGNPKEIIERKGIITIGDPCCGGGSMAIATLDVLKNEYGINYARDCMIICDDLDIRCVYMTYLQLSLAGAPAIVRHQDSLTLQRYSEWYTPTFILQYPRFARFV